MMYPKISVVIPSYNQGNYIERTLLSILGQDYPGAVEIIVADGGSKDNTLEILQKYSDRIIWWSREDNGFADAVNKGFSVATGDIYAIQSSDDFYLKDAFKNLIKGFDEYPNASLIAGRDVYLNQDSELSGYGEQEGEVSPYSILFNYTPPQHAIFFKKKYFDMAGGLRSDGGVCSEIELWYKITHFAKGHFISCYVAVYQFHQNQMTQKQSSKIFNALTGMVEFCELSDSYNKKFKLSLVQKDELFDFWKIIFSNEQEVYVQNNLRDKNLRKKLNNHINIKKDLKSKPHIGSKILRHLSDGTLLGILRKKIKKRLIMNKPDIFWYKNL